MSNGPASLTGRRLESLRAVPRLLRTLPDALSRPKRARSGKPRTKRARSGKPRVLCRLPHSLPSLSPRFRRRLLLIFVACLTLAAGYQFWLRDSSLVAVDEVEVTGLTAADSKQVRIALTAAARDMTTLNVEQAKLDRAVRAYPVVRALEVTTDFPNGLRVHVVEHHAAALAVGDTGKLPVAGDGTILRGLPIEGSLPVVEVGGVLGNERLRDPTALASAAVAGAAPSVLRRRIDTVVKRSDQGLVAELSDGPELIFGSASRLRAKWAAAARVLADPEARGASYIDLRIPGRPAAGGLPATTVDIVAPTGVDPATAAVDPTTTGVDPATGLPLAGAPDPALPEAPGVTPTTPVAPTPAPPVTSGTGGGMAAPTTP